MENISEFACANLNTEGNEEEYNLEIRRVMRGGAALAALCSRYSR